MSDDTLRKIDRLEREAIGGNDVSLIALARIAREEHTKAADNARLREALQKDCPFDHAVTAANAVALCVNCGAALREVFGG